MTLALDVLPAPDSPIRRLDARWKLAALLLAVASAAALQTLPASALALLGSLALAATSRLPARWFLTRLGTLALLLSGFVVLLPFLVQHGEPDGQWGPIHWSWYGARVALLLCLKALTIVTLMLIALVTSPLSATVQAAHALRAPGLLVQLVLLTYRYLFVLAAELARLRTALRVRGYRNRMDRHSYRTVGQVAGTLLVRGYERSERVSQAMRCRGFDGRFRSLSTFHTRPADVAAFVAITAIAAGLLGWDLSYR
jgi:cobalt/nickel transport system permease protein